MTDLRRRIESDLRASRKYRHLCEETINRIAAWVAERYAPRDALKAARRKLHQVYAAFGAQSAESLQRISQIPEEAGEEILRAVCREVLGQHRSTAERLPILDELYPALWREIGPPTSVVDLACGFHPFALPWMSLPPGAAYHAFDIDHQLIAALNSFFTRLGRPATASCKDLLVSVPPVRGDVAFLFKTLPCLEQQEKGVAARLLRAIRCPWVVVSFPHETLGGKRKGMRGYYHEFITALAGSLGAALRKLELGNESFYLLKTSSLHPLPIAETEPNPYHEDKSNL
jgi:16S rRNA (guanine(1405)-N(7))-methyltransferase